MAEDAKQQPDEEQEKTADILDSTFGGQVLGEIEKEQIIERLRMSAEDVEDLLRRAKEAHFLIPVRNDGGLWSTDINTITQNGKIIVDSNDFYLREFVLFVARLIQRGNNGTIDTALVEDPKGNEKLVPHLLASQLMQKNIFTTIMEDNRMFYYNNGLYHMAAENLIKKIAKEKYSEHVTKRVVDETIHHIQSATFIKNNEFETEKNYIRLQNGIFDLDTNELLPFTPLIKCMVGLPVEHNTQADCPEIKKFISEIVNPEDIPIVQEIIGYCLMKGYPIQKAVMFLGGGSNGKSTLLMLVRKFFGEENVAQVPLQAFETNRFASSQLYNKLANTYADVPDAALQRTGTFKMLTGGDAIPGEHKFKNAFTFVNRAKLIFSANKLPETRDDTDAFFRRWVFVNFPNVFEGETADKNLIDKLTTPEELSGLLNWALEGMRRLQEKGEFSHSISTDELRDRYTRLSDSLAAFVSDYVEYTGTPDDFVSKETFYNNYVAYCKHHNLPIKAKNVVGANLPRHISGVSSKQKHDGERGWASIIVNIPLDMIEEAQKTENGEYN